VPYVEGQYFEIRKVCYSVPATTPDIIIAFSPVTRFYSMRITLPEIDQFLQQTGLACEVWPCGPELADTAVFCEH